MNNCIKYINKLQSNIATFSQRISNGIRKANQNFTGDMLYGMIKKRSCLLTEIARGLKEPIKENYTVDRLSTRLNALDEDEKKKMMENYYNETMGLLPDKYVIVLNDNTDLNKEYSKKLEDLCKVVDASSRDKRIVNGYLGCEYVALTRKTKTPISLYSYIYSTESKEFESENKETLKGEEIVNNIMKSNNRIPIYVRDRGYDANVFFDNDLKNDNKFVTRLKKNRDLIYDGDKINVAKLSKKIPNKCSKELKYKGEKQYCQIGYASVILPSCPDKKSTLVVVEGLKTYEPDDDNSPFMLLTNLEVKDANDALKIAKLYLLRWRIEEYFKSKKTFNWENSLVRELNAMNNLNFFLSLSMFYLTTLIEQKDTVFVQGIIKWAKSLKTNVLVFFGIIETGIVEILSHTFKGIRKYIRKSSKKARQDYVQLTLDLGV